MSMLVGLLGSLFVREDGGDGQGLAEYALILALIAVVAVVAVLYLGGALSNQLTTIGQAVSSAAP
jgi:Flp pilus assembly pilin Flp